MIDAPTFVLAVCAALALHLLPGLAFVKWFWRADALDWSEQVALVLGIGVALPPLLLELAHLVNLSWSGGTTAAYLMANALALLFWAWRARYTPPRLGWHTYVLLLLFVCAVAVRLYAVRDLPAGLWGDSYQHTMLAQVLVDHGGLFSSWEPYAPLATLTYHYGFHANVAFLHWLTGVPVTQSVLLMGQWLNALTVPLAYLLTTRLMRDSRYAPFAGLCAALLTGFVNTQPAYFVNWGRYTQLTGQIILPVVLVTWLALADELTAVERNPSLRTVLPAAALAAILTACLMLTHYIVTIFAALFVATYGVTAALRHFDGRAWLRLLVGTGATALASALLALPWLLNTLGGFLIRNTSAFVSGAVSAERVAQYSALPTPMPFFIKDYLLWLAALGLLCALVRRDGRVASLGVWTGLLFLTIRPQTFGLPGAGVVDFFTAYIALYLTVIPLAAYPLGLLYASARVRAAWQRLTHTLQRASGSAVVGVLLALMGWGVSWQQNIVDTNYELLTPADWRAMDWIRTHTPPDARIAVNAFPAFGGTLVAGSDGGWWVPLLTLRQTNLPPLTYGSEQGAAPDFAYRVNTFAETLRGRPLTDATPVAIDLTQPRALQALRVAGIGYVYIGAHANPDATSADHFDVQALHRSAAFRLLYAQDGVEIFQIVNPE